MNSEHAKRCEDAPCDCAELRASVYALVDGHLSESDCARLKAHLAACPSCADCVAAEEELRTLLRQCCCDSAPVTLRERITYSIRVERTRRA